MYCIASTASPAVIKQLYQKIVCLNSQCIQYRIKVNCSMPPYPNESDVTYSTDATLQNRGGLEGRVLSDFSHTQE